MDEMTLRPATPGDFAFIRRLAADPANAPFITDEDETALQAYLDDPDAALLIWQADGARGYALFNGLTDKAGSVELRRLALDQPGGGRGRAFVGALVDHAFTVWPAKRLWLDASGENLRAQHLYESLGFRLEGQLRRHWWRPALGRAVDMMLYGMLRDEWQALKA
jgi:RimJ/RimL family protein N-acetyltransferase